ncbi:Transcriptional regulator PadR-like family protein [Phycisphaerae bacterium RAS1]|nr:Transcriptional regulator PadR-like family protein [Phycisphaerae bacterium RAS1]
MKALTDAELLLLGLAAEMPRHGYQLDQVIRQRGMREWTQIGFSSIYFVLGKLQKLRLVAAKKSAAVKAGKQAEKSRSGTKTRKVYSVTPAGRRALAAQTIAALRDVRPAYASVLLGMINWPALRREQALDALQARSKTVEAEVARLRAIQVERQPLPDYVEALFDYSLGQLRAEAEWVSRTWDYMSTKPWLD